VKDTGVGLTEEEKEKIFARFYRVDDARNHEAGGVGLGLNIAEYIVRNHGGRIKIDSVPNKGGTFTVVLPKTGNYKQETKKSHNMLDDDINDKAAV
jgi:signal transduction histidine kinase